MLIETATPFKAIQVTLPPVGSHPRAHEIDERSCNAVNTALASGRPLLVRGEPGVGKTQLAEAVAKLQERAFLKYAVTSRTDAQDLLWTFDAVSRLAEAQVLPRLEIKTDDTEEKVEQRREWLRKDLSIDRFVEPGPIWWALNAESAGNGCSDESNQLDVGNNRQRSKNGWVLLIDEIDKAESDLPNGLLEALGSRRFRPQGQSEYVELAADTPAPLIVVTTNEDRVLPDAFVRRCLVLHLRLPKTKVQFTAQMVRRGQLHFDDRSDDFGTVLKSAAGQLWEDRMAAEERNLRPLPGQAEYLDLLHAVTRWKKTPNEQIELLKSISQFTFRKHESLQDETSGSGQPSELYSDDSAGSAESIA